MKKGLLISVLCLFLLTSLVIAQDCGVDAENTDAFLNEISALNAKLDECDVDVPSPMDRLFGDDVINVQIVRNDGSKDVLTITTQDGKVTSIEDGGSDNPTYVATLAECALDNVLKSDDKAGALAYLYDKGHLTIGAHGVWRSIVFRVVMFFAGGAIEEASTEVDPTCPKKAVGELCNHGGECETGNCIGIIPGGVYKCSCDPFEYDPYTDSEGNCPNVPEYPESETGQPGDICQHGGQCETGNCIYSHGEGAERTYKCSCDPFKLDTYSC